MNKFLTKLRKLFYKHYYKERFNRLFDIANNRTITVDIEKNKKIIFSDNGKTSGLRSRSILFKEKSTIEWINRFEEKSFFIDIGASVGTFTLLAAIKKECKVISIEPSASNFAILNLNIFRNNLNDRVTAFPFVASYKNDLDFFFKTKVSLDESGGYPYKEVDPRGVKFTSNYKQGVVCFKIDDLVDKFGCPDHIKIDVDGNEFELLKGMTKTLETGKIKSIMVELNENLEHYQEILTLFKQSNYNINNELTSIADVSRKRGGVIYNHYFFKNE